MSLINDALKRAKQAQQDNPSPPAPGPQFRPAELGQRRSAAPGMLLVIVLVIVVSLGGFFVWWVAQARNTTRQTVAVAGKESPAAEVTPATVVPPQASEPTPQPAVAVTPPAPTSNAVVAAGAAEAEIAPANSASNAEPVAPEAPLKPSPPKLQGIFYRPDRPAAIVNGKTVFLGDQVGEFRVLAISAESVTLESAGQTNVLTLEHH
jgi:hypothetical protein